MTHDDFRKAYEELRFPGPAARLGTPEYQGWVRHLAGCRACVDWYQGEEVKRRGIDPSRYPCVHLAYYTASWLDDSAPVEGVKPRDTAILYTPKFDEFGVHLFDHSVIVIRHCPWCGVELPASRRAEWLTRLEALGITDPADPRMPEEFKTDAWYRGR